MVERPHGHLLISGDLLSGEDQTFATTNWMFGVFSSHVVLGNTNIQKLTGNVRNHLNLNKISGFKNTYKSLTVHIKCSAHLIFMKWG